MGVFVVSVPRVFSAKWVCAGVCWTVETRSAVRTAVGVSVDSVLRPFCIAIQGFAVMCVFSFVRVRSAVMTDVGVFAERVWISFSSVAMMVCVSWIAFWIALVKSAVRTVVGVFVGPVLRRCRSAGPMASVSSIAHFSVTVRPVGVMDVVMSVVFVRRVRAV